MSATYSIITKNKEGTFDGFHLQVFEPKDFEHDLGFVKNSEAEAQKLFAETQALFGKKATEIFHLDTIEDVKEAETNTTCLWEDGKWYLSWLDAKGFYPLKEILQEIYARDRGDKEDEEKFHKLAEQDGIYL